MSAKPPRIDLGRVTRLRDFLVASVILPRSGQQMSGEQLESLATALRSSLKLPATAKSVLFESVRYLAGRVMTPADGYELAWRLAGNIQRLRDHRVVLPWARQTEPEWVPLQIIKATPSRRASHNSPGFVFDFRALAGTPCPLRLTVFWSSRQARYISRYVGFSAPWGKFPYHQPADLVGLRLFGLVDPALSEHAPTFHNVHTPSGMITWNRSHVLRRRCRVDPCPNKWNHPCRQCTVGYQTCPASTHRLDYVARTCQGCGRVAWFDDEQSQDRCISCYHKELRST